MSIDAVLPFDFHRHNFIFFIEAKDKEVYLHVEKESIEVGEYTKCLSYTYFVECRLYYYRLLREMLRSEEVA